MLGNGLGSRQKRESKARAASVFAGAPRGYEAYESKLFKKCLLSMHLKLTEKETKSFQLKTAGERALEKVQAIGQFLGNVGRFLRGVAELGNKKH